MGAGITGGTVVGGIWTAITSGTGAMDVTNIPTNYKQLRIFALTNATAIKLKFNNDGGANYYWDINASGSDYHSEGDTGIQLTRSGQAYTALVDVAIVNIPAATKHVTGTVSGYQGGASSNSSNVVSGSWTDATHEINRVTLSGTPVYWVLMGAVLP